MPAKPTPEMIARQLADQNERNRRAAAEAEEEQKRKLAAQQGNGTTPHAQDDVNSTRSTSPTPCTYTVAPTAPISHGNIPPEILRIIKAYEELYGKKPEQNKEGQHIFSFNTLDDARSFFQTQASQKLSFMMIEVGKGFSGHNFFSCGDGRLYEGSLNNIQAGLESTLKEDPNNSKTQEGLQRIKTYIAKDVLNQHRTTPEPTPPQAAPTPCPTTPKPPGPSHL